MAEVVQASSQGEARVEQSSPRPKPPAEFLR